MLKNERPEAHIAACATATPTKVPIAHFLDVNLQHRQNRGQKPETLEMFKKIVAGTGI